MFDLGLRKDSENFPPAIQQLLALWKTHGFEMAAETMCSRGFGREGLIQRASIRSFGGGCHRCLTMSRADFRLIFSHSHLDHTGYCCLPQT